MMPVGRPRFEVIAAASATDRRLVSAATVRALTGLDTGDVSDEALELQIDAVLARCARACRLATERATAPTLAQEAVRATWLQDCWDWSGLRIYPAPYRGREPSQLLLPWRVPITSVEITEGETELVENTDFRLLGAGVVERLGGAFWPTSGSVVVDYTAGWVPLSDDPSYDYDGEPMPADLVALIADQVRFGVLQSAENPTLLRSEDIPGVWSGSYSTPGGDSVDTSGLIRPLYDALQVYRAPPTFA